MGSSCCPPLPHIAIFPFMAQGHTIPLIHLARLIRRRRLATLTFFTTPLNAPSLRASLADDDDAVITNIISLPFPPNPPDLPPNIESTDRLPSISLLLPFCNATKLLQPHFESALRTLPQISFLISDGFLGWTVESAVKFGFPRLVFHAMNGFGMLNFTLLVRGDPFVVTGLPNVTPTKSDFQPPFDGPDPKHPWYEFVAEQLKAQELSQGVLVNTFYELESFYLDHWNNSIGPKAWSVGPLNLAPPPPPPPKSKYTQWLDLRSSQQKPVVYIAFGSQADVSADQLREIAVGLENSGLDFLWVVRTQGVDLGDGFEDRVKNRGKVVREWVDQAEILRHESVKGFVSHCGWGSVMESLCAAVPMLAWPMMADQGLYARFAVEGLGIGVRVREGVGMRFGMVGREEVERMVRELVVGEKGKVAGERVKELAAAAEKAMGDGGSSVVALEMMIKEVCGNGVVGLGSDLRI